MPKIGFLYVGSVETSPSQATAYLSAVRQSFVNSAEQVFKASNMFNPSSAIIAHTFDSEALLAPGICEHVAINELYEQKPEVLVTIIDTFKLSESKINEVRAKVFTLGHRTIGAVTHCTKKSSFDRTDDKKPFTHPAGMESFPARILRQINLAKGGRNYDPEPVTEWLQKKPIMVVGAYISHQDAQASKHRSSVAAIVANSDLDLLHYPASVRKQATLRAGQGSLQSEIADLEGMMTERFRLWHTANNGRQPDVIFYRHGLIKPSRHIITREMEAIRNAFFEVFASKKLTVSYVVLHKSGTGSNAPQWKEPNFFEDRVVFGTPDLQSSGRGANYSYHVPKEIVGVPRLDWNCETYEKLVRISY